MLLGAPHGQALVDQRAEGELVDGVGEHARDEDRTALAAGVNGLPYGGGTVGLQPQLLLDLVVKVHGTVAVGFHADGLDAHVGATAAGALAQFRPDVGARVVDDLAADVPLGHLQTLGDPVDGDHTFRAQQDRGACRHLADGPATPHCDHVAGLHPGQIGAHPARGHRVGHEQGARVVDALRYGEGPVVGEGHAHVLGMAAAQPAHGVGVAEDAAGVGTNRA